MATERLGQAILKGVRLSFPQLWEPKASVEDGTPKYRGAFLMDPETPIGQQNITKLEAAIEAVKVDHWKEKAAKIKFKEDRYCLREGDSCTSQETGEVYQGYENMMVISAASKKRVPVVDTDKSPLTAEDDKPYAGCFVNAVVSIYAISDSDKGGNGIFAELKAIQFVRDGESFGAAPIVIDDVFDDISGDVDEDEV